MCASLQPYRGCCQNSVETEIIRGITNAHAYSCTAGLSAKDRYEKGVVLTHWLCGMLQPQHLTGPYLSRADCRSWYASVIFVGKKDTAVRERWVKKRATDISSLPCGLFMTVIICLAVLTLRRRHFQCNQECIRSPHHLSGLWIPWILTVSMWLHRFILASQPLHEKMQEAWSRFSSFHLSP